MATPSKDANAPGANAHQDMEELKRRFEKLRERRITAEADLKNANHELDRLRAEARDKYGTDDLGELTRKLEEMKAENEARRAEYQRHLDSIEAKLAEVEREFSSGKKE